MTQDEIIEMARQADELSAAKVDWDYEWVVCFAKLVAAKEREACASICFQQIARWTDDRARFAAGECSKAIRARGQTFEPCPFIECGCDGNHPKGQGVVLLRGEA